MQTKLVKMPYLRCAIGAVLTILLLTVLPKRSRDSVSGDVLFRRPVVELLFVTMHSPVTQNGKAPG